MSDKKLVFVTTNTSKFREAYNVMDQLGIKLKQMHVSIPELQSESFEDIAVDKCKRAYEVVRRPLIINDSGWIFSALRGFPGPFMKFINNWFLPEDFINLMSIYKNRKVILREMVVFTDGNFIKFFKHDINGRILTKISGEKGPSSDKVICLSSDGRSISEANQEANSKMDIVKRSIWRDFAEWYVSQQRV